MITQEQYDELVERIESLESRMNAPAQNGNGSNESWRKTAILRALLDAEAAGDSSMSRCWLAVMVGLSPMSSGLNMVISTMRKDGTIYFPIRDRVALLDVGRDKAKCGDSVRPPLTKAALLAKVVEVMDKPDSDLIVALGNSPNETMSRKELGDKSSTVRDRIVKLTKLGFIESETPGFVSLRR